MILGIVGSEESKFTESSKHSALMVIKSNIHHYKATAVCSGSCHLGGIDLWAIEVAKELELETIEFPPKFRSWAAYKERNIKIAETSDVVVCITVGKLPESYTGMRFDLCYHCGTKDHVKSGGCWTTKYARKLGKEAFTVVVG